MVHTSIALVGLPSSCVTTSGGEYLVGRSNSSSSEFVSSPVISARPRSEIKTVSYGKSVISCVEREDGPYRGQSAVDNVALMQIA